MLAWLPIALFFAAPTVAASSAPHRIDVHVAGPLVMVDVWRAVEAKVQTAADKPSASFLDLAFPEGAALLDLEIVDGKNHTRLAPQSEVQANAGLRAALKMRGLSSPATQGEEGVDFRVYLSPIGESEKATLHYRYVALAGCRNGRLVVRVPESPEPDPVAPEVSVTIDPLPDGTPIAEASLASKPVALKKGTRKIVMRGQAPARGAWEIAWSYARGARKVPGFLLAAMARSSGKASDDGHARNLPRAAVAALLCRDEPDAKPVEGGPVLPGRVLLLIDRSRSVGQGGLSAERALARALVEVLPPSVMFNAILFGLEATPVFKLPRMPTKEALDLFENAADPNRLENGTDVAGALARTRASLGDRGDEATSPAWIVLITDGALPASQTFTGMAKALSAGPVDAHRKLLVLLVRQPGDEDVAPSVVTEYAQLARTFGGIVRALRSGSARDNAKELVQAMANGGDWLDLRVGDGRLADAVAPGQGTGVALALRKPPSAGEPVRVHGRGLDGEIQVESTPAIVKSEWIAPVLSDAQPKRPAWSAASDGMAVTVLPATPALKSDSDQVVRGRMDPTVLRNALSLAFLPRARACYVSRRVAKASDAYLTGRVKLALTIERGELHDAAITQSSLGNVDVERCVRDAAWAIDYPRPEHRDAPTVANLNLVFQPRTPRESAPDAGATDREIELVLGPLTFTTDFTDLLETKQQAKSPP